MKGYLTVCDFKYSKCAEYLQKMLPEHTKVEDPLAFFFIVYQNYKINTDRAQTQEFSPKTTQECFEMQYMYKTSQRLTVNMVKQ